MKYRNKLELFGNIISNFLKMIYFPSVLLLYASVIILCTAFPEWDDKILLGISEKQVLGVIDYVEFAKWSVLACSPILINGVILEKLEKISSFMIVRLGGLRRLRIYGLALCAINSTLWSLCLSARAGFVQGINIVFYFLIVWSNVLLFTALGSLVQSVTGARDLAGAIMIMVMGGMCIVGERFPAISQYLPTTWGMLSKSEIYKPDGFSLASMIIMNILLGTALLSGLLFSKRRV